MIDLWLRCFSRARWLTFAENRGILDAAGAVQPGYAVDELGNYEISPAVLNPDGSILTPANLDTWWSVNVRLHGLKADEDVDSTFAGEDAASPYKFTRSKLVRFVREQSTPVTILGMRAYQFGTTTNRIQLLDPRDLAPPHPKRVWLGGMVY